MEPDDQPRVLRTEFETLFRRTYHRAFSLAYRLTSNVSDAEDLTQDAFLRAWVSFAQYDRCRSFETWLLRIVSNLAIDRWRKRSLSPMASLDQSYCTDGADSLLGSMLQDDAPGPEQRCLETVLGPRLQAALGMLPEPYRTAVILADIEERSYEEVAEHMRCPLGTVRSRLHRARLVLRRSLTSPQMVATY